MADEEYQDRAGEILSGYVRRIERNNIIVDLGRVEALMPAKEQMQGEEGKLTEKVRHGTLLQIQF